MQMTIFNESCNLALLFKSLKEKDISFQADSWHFCSSVQKFIIFKFYESVYIMSQYNTMKEFLVWGSKGD